MIGETWRVLAWKWSIQYGTARDSWKSMSVSANKMFRHLDGVCVLAHPAIGSFPAWPSLPDVNDAPVFSAARSGECSHVVSVNTHHYPPGGTYEGVTYLGPQEFLELIGWPIP